ncbi:MAG: hypothetical protein QOJ73_2588 [Streptosporangiaceae bacterium]|jgi:hypothetical protein|nr:hypothetical protein [Streptosporangiaceae bacterium]
MRAAQMNAVEANGRRRPEAKDGAISRNRARPGTRRARAGTGSHPGPRLRGLRWVPVPLAALAAMLGLLVVGSMQGQAAATRAQNGYRAGGLALAVDQMLWMSNDMTGQGPLKVPKGFPMDPSMMPGMQSANDNRLRVEFIVRNVTTDVERYAMSDFRVVAPGGKSWTVNGNGINDSATSGFLGPRFEVSIDMYFDIPTSDTRYLTVQWSRDGTTVSIPVNTGNAVPNKMSGM